MIRWLASLLYSQKQIEVENKLEYPNETHITPNFSFREALPPKTEWSDLSEKEKSNLLQTMLLAESVRAEVGEACIANTYPYGGSHRLRGYRTKAHQRDLIKRGFTRVKYSKHLEGKAIDLACPGISVYEFGNIAAKYFNTVLIYESRGFIHCDTDLRGGKKLKKIM